MADGIETVQPRVYRVTQGQEQVLVNASPTTQDVAFEEGEEAVRLESGQMAVRWAGGWRDHLDVPQLDLLRSLVPQGLRDDEELQAHLATLPDLWGPAPDVRLTEQTGSGRLWAGLCPAGVLAVHTHDTVAAGRAWVAAQGMRGCHYPWLKPGRIDDDEPLHFLGQGYSTMPDAQGGFSELYGAVRPQLDGVPYPASGWPVPTSQHATVDALVWYALRFNSYAAMLAAFGQWSGLVTELDAGGYMPSRSWGWLLKASAYIHVLADAHPLFPVSATYVSLWMGRAMDALEGRGYLGSVAPDSGNGGSEGGHLEGKVSDCSWFVGIALTGLLDCADLAPNVSPIQRDRLVERCLGFLSSCWQEDAQAFVDDRAPLEGAVAFNPSAVRSVQARFILPGLLRLERQGRLDLAAWTRPIIDDADAAGWWGGGADRQLWRAEVGLVE